jgi:phosphohistidine swiveling domain-containing protein
MSALRDAAAGGAPPVVMPSATGAPLPAAFRLADDDVVVPVVQPSSEAGHGAGGGRVSAPVHNRPAVAGADRTGTDVPDGAVLVVPTLDPSLAPLLPRLGSLVAETGSVLSHLAILAREYGVPTVVGLAGATGRFADGTWVVVDGPDQGALSLVAACAGTGGHNRVDGRSIRLVGDGTVRFSVEPALGTHNRRKLVGCLEDATIDRLRGDVVSIETIAP